MMPIVDLIVIQEAAISTNLSEFITKIVENMETSIPGIIVIAAYPYSMDVQFIATSDHVVGVLRQPVDVTELYLLLSRPKIIATSDSKTLSSGNSSSEFLKKYCHDVNNFLERIMTATSYLEEAEFGDFVNKLATDASLAVRHLSRYVFRMAMLERSLSEVDSDFNISFLFKRIVDDLEEFYPDTEFLLNTIENEEKIHGNQQDIKLLLEELLRNAAEADAAKKGQVQVEYTVDQSVPVIRIINGGAPLKFDQLPEELGERRGEKDPCFHKGIGLPLVHRIATRNNWKVKLIPGEETTEVVLLLT
jgi:anti-sigma regulatory factor (Ser/Thr protein kinase)